MLTRTTLLLGIAASFLSCTIPRGRGYHPTGFDLPSVVLWVWQRPEDLGFIDSKTTGLAVLAGTAAIAADGSVRYQPRLEPVRFPPAARVIAVVRVEATAPHSAVDSAALTHALREAAAIPNVRGLQVDFDARRSERALYRTVLASLPQRPSVTALASWCEGDRWLDQQPVAEAVPMFFRMGRGEYRDATVRSPVCRDAIGLSTDEPWPLHRPAPVKRIYLFNPRSWTRADYQAALTRIGAWR